MTVFELRDLIISSLIRRHGGSRLRWRSAIGDIKLYPLSTHAHCNWEVRANGSIAEISAVEAAVDAVRPLHPIVTSG